MFSTNPLSRACLCAQFNLLCWGRFRDRDRLQKPEKPAGTKKKQGLDHPHVVAVAVAAPPNTTSQLGQTTKLVFFDEEVPVPLELS